MSVGVEPLKKKTDLQVARSAVPVVDPAPGPALAYHLFSPAARAAYLGWLAGARNADVPFFFQAEDGIRVATVTGVQTCALPISGVSGRALLPRREGDDDLRGNE